MKRNVLCMFILIFGAATWAAIGCAAPDSPPPAGFPAGDSAPSFDARFQSITAGPGQSKPTGGDVLTVVDLVFDVAVIDLPIQGGDGRQAGPTEGMRHAAKVWNHVDEMRIDPALTSRLARNGLRVGAASSEAWAPLRAIFEASDAQVRRDQIPVQRNLPFIIRLGEVPDEETIFTLGPDGRLQGKTFFAGEKLFVMDYLYHPDLSGTIDLNISFEIRHDRGEMTWENVGGVIRQVPAFDRHVFSELVVPVTLYPQEFVVIGPGDKARNEYLIGSRFFTPARAGRRVEILLCITPVPVHKQATHRHRW